MMKAELFWHMSFTISDLVPVGIWAYHPYFLNATFSTSAVWFDVLSNSEFSMLDYEVLLINPRMTDPGKSVRQTLMSS